MTIIHPLLCFIIEKWVKFRLGNGANVTHQKKPTEYIREISFGRRKEDYNFEEDPQIIRDYNESTTEKKFSIEAKMLASMALPIPIPVPVPAEVSLGGDLSVSISQRRETVGKMWGRLIRLRFNPRALQR